MCIAVCCVYLDEGLKALVFGMVLLVQVHSLVVATAEPPVDLLHMLSMGTRELEKQKCWSFQHTYSIYTHTHTYISVNFNTPL